MSELEVEVEISGSSDEMWDFEQCLNVTNSTDLCPAPHNPMPQFILTIIQIFYGLVCVLGLLGNSLVIYVVLRFSKMYTVTNIYILNLAIADECFLVGIPFLIWTSAVGYWPFGSFMCKAYYTSTAINQITSSIFLMVMSADRYMAVCHPISAPRFRTPMISKAVSFTSWAASALLMLPIFLFASTITRETAAGPVDHCNIFWSNFSETNSSVPSILNEMTAFTFYSFGTGFAAPLSLISVFYILVIVKLQSVGPRTPSRSQNKRKSHRRVTKLVLTVIAVYILCWLPYWVTQLALITREPALSQTNTMLVIHLLANLLAYSNSTMNPVLYAFLSDNFKQSFMKACKCLATRNNNHRDEYSATTRRSRRGPKFNPVPHQGDSEDEDRGPGADISTGITMASRTSKFIGKDAISSAITDNKVVVNARNGNAINTINGALAPPTAL